MRAFISILINAVLFLALAGYIDGFHVSGVGSAIIASCVLSILNIIVKPILILLTLPITVVTLGLFLFVINAITLMITDKLMGDNFEISSFGLAIVVSILLSIANIIIQKALINPASKK